MRVYSKPSLARGTVVIGGGGHMVLRNGFDAGRPRWGEEGWAACAVTAAGDIFLSEYRRASACTQMKMCVHAHDLFLYRSTYARERIGKKK